MSECPQCGAQNAEGERFCASCGGALEVALEAIPDSVPSPVEPGTLIEDKYRVLEEIGRGGMGVVYRGHDISLHRLVAIKVLPEHFNTEDEVIARFKKEARAMAALDQPNIVPVYAIGQQQNFHYFVMKYLDGETIAEILERDEGAPFRFPPEVVKSIVIQLCKGLGHAHSRGLVHRDIKPGNIMLDPDGHVTIMDFGIVKEESANEHLTRTGLVFGTPEYMAPEQAQGDLPPSASTDLYSLGIVAYEMLTGRPPFRGETPFSVVLKHIKNPPEPIVEQIPDVNPAFQRAIFKALRKKPSERYQTADEMRMVIEAAPTAVQAPLPVATQLPGTLPPPPAPTAPVLGAAPPATVNQTPPIAPSRPSMAPRPAAIAARQTTGAPLRARPTPAPVAAAQPLAPRSPDEPVVLDDRPGHYRQFLTRPPAPTTTLEPAAKPAPPPPSPPMQSAPSATPVPSGPMRRPPSPQKRRQIEARAAATRAMRQPPSSGSRSTLIIGLAILGLVGLALLAYALTRPKAVHSEEVIDQNVTEQTVELTIESTPAGARVFAFGDQGPALGQTPLTVTRPKGEGSARFVVTLPDHASQQVALPLSADGTVSAELVADE